MTFNFSEDNANNKPLNYFFAINEILLDFGHKYYTFKFLDNKIPLDFEVKVEIQFMTNPIL